jgi:RND family efflux transporter MFP subunit
MKKYVITLLILLAVVALGYKAKQLLDTRKAEAANAKPPAAVTVQVSTVKPTKGTLVNSQRFLAQIQADKGIKLSTKLAGTIEKIYVQTGARVHRGDPLVRIDSRELKMTIDSLKAALSAQESDAKFTEATYEANQKLFKAGALPRQKLDQSRVGLSGKRAQVEATRQKIAQLEHQITYLDITAPFDGQIDAVLLHQGDLAAAGRPIIAMSDGNKKLVFGFVPTATTSIKANQPVMWGQEQIGAVRTIYATSQNGLVHAEVALTRPIDLPVGASIDIDVAIRAAQGCILPEDTLIHTAKGVRLMHYSEGHFEPMNVEVRAQNSGQVIVDPCPVGPVARGSEVRLAQLPAYHNVLITGADHGEH